MSRVLHTRFLRSIGLISPEQISGNTFFADMLDNSFVYSSANIVGQILNKTSIGVIYPETTTNGLFNADVSGWVVQQCTLVWDATNGGSMKVTNTAAAQGFGHQTLTLIAGKVYRVRAVTVGAGNATTSNIQMRDNTGAATITTKTVSSANATFDFTFLAPSSNIEIRLMNDAVSGHFLFWDNVSVMQIDAEVQSTVGNQGQLVSSAINGKPAVQFDGATTYYFNGSKSAIGLQFTKFATVKFDFSSTNTCNIISSPTLTDHSQTISKFSATVARISCNQGNLSFDLTNLDVQNTFTIIEIFDSTGTKALWINGVKVVTGSTSKTITDFSYYLGSYGTLAAASFYKGLIADHGTYNRMLSDTEIMQLDEHQRKRWRVPQDSDSYISVAGIGQSNEVGLANVAADVIVTGSGLNFIPSYRHYRDTNDPTGESYSKSLPGSSWPAFANKLKQLSARRIIHITCGKTGTSISTVASSNPSDRLFDWGPGSTLRANFLAGTQAMLTYFGKSKLEWVVINQGERDYSYMVGDPTWTKDTYKSAFLDLMNYCRGNFPGCKILIIQSVQSRNTGVDTPQNTPQWTSVITAQQELAAEQLNTFIIQNTSTFTITNGNIEASDGVHYTKAGNLLIGESAATKISQNL